MAKRRSYSVVGGGGRPRANWWKNQLGVDYYRGGQGYSAEYQAVLDKGTSLGASLPSSSRQSVENSALQIILDEPGLWDKVVLFLNYQTDGDSAFATINWKDPDSFQATLVNSPAFTASQGFRSNGTTSYIDHNFTLAEVNQESVCYFGKGLDNAQGSNSFLFGGANAQISSTAVYINPRNISDQLVYRVSGSTSVTVASTTEARNRLCIGRDGGNVFHSINGTAKVTAANTYSAIDGARKLYSVGIETSGGAAGFNTRGSAYFVVTDLLTDEEIAVMDAALDALTA